MGDHVSTAAAMTKRADRRGLLEAAGFQKQAPKGLTSIIGAGSFPGFRNIQTVVPDDGHLKSSTRFEGSSPKYRNVPPAPLAGHRGTRYLKKSSSPMADAPQGNSLGMAAMIVGTCGIALYWLPWVNLICPAGSVIFGTIALQRASKQKATGKLPAITGLILGGVLFLIGLFVIEVALSLTAILDQSSEASP